MPHIDGDREVGVFREGGGHRAAGADFLLGRRGGGDACTQFALRQTPGGFEHRIGTRLIVEAPGHADAPAN